MPNLKINFFLKLKKTDEFKINIFWNYFSLIILAISGIAINTLISIYYSANTLGVFNQVLAGYIVFSMFGSGGINYSVLRAIQSNLENQKEVKSIIAGCFLPTLIISSLVTLIYYLLIGPTIRFLDSYSVGIGMHYIMPGVFFFSINKVLLYGIFNGLNRMKIFSIYQSLRYILILISLIICFLLRVEGEKLTLIFSVGEFILFLILISDISMYVSWWEDHFLNHWVIKHFKYGTKCLLGGMLIELNTKVDILMIGFFMGDYNVGIYSFAALFGEGFYQLLIVLQNVLNPFIANSLSRPNEILFYQKYKNVRNSTYKYMALIAFISIILYPIFIKFFIKKAEYASSFQPFIILLIGITLASGYIPFYNIFSMADLPKLQSKFVLSIFLTNVLANITFIPIFGYNGAALGTAISMIASIIYFKYLTNNYLQIKSR